MSLDVNAAADALRRYTPTLVYDSCVGTQFTHVEALVEHPNAVLRDPFGRVIAATSQGHPRLSLEFLRHGSYPTGADVTPGDWIGYPTYPGSTRAGATDDAVYGRVLSAQDERGRLRGFIQYWLIGPFGHRRIGRSRDCIGAVQLVQLMLTADWRDVERVLVTQHDGAEVRPIDQVETLDGGPKLYVARGTGTLLFGPGSRWMRAGSRRDRCDGAGRIVIPTLVPLHELAPAWTRWPGRFGASPAPCARPYWQDPQLAWRLAGKRGLSAWVPFAAHDPILGRKGLDLGVALRRRLRSTRA